jgi:hypothetical protein
MPVDGHTDVEVIVNVDDDLVSLVGLDHGSWEEVVHSVDLSWVAIRCSGNSTTVAVNKGSGWRGSEWAAYLMFHQYSLVV